MYMNEIIQYFHSFFSLFFSKNTHIISNFSYSLIFYNNIILKINIKYINFHNESWIYFHISSSLFLSSLIHSLDIFLSISSFMHSSISWFIYPCNSHDIFVSSYALHRKRSQGIQWNKIMCVCVCINVFLI